MKFTRVVAFAVIGASLCVGAVHAQNLRNGRIPAEYPPASYRGAQYVDSNGCVFIRAGIDGNVTWVPRVNRARQLLCGQTPTLSAEAAQNARVAPRANPSARGVEQITVTPPAQTAQTSAQTAAPAPAPKPAAPVRAATKPAPPPRQVVTVTPPQPVAAQPAARVVVRRPVPAPAPVATVPPKVVTAPVPAPVQRAEVVQRQPACQGASPISSRYINSGAIAPVRCGPQAVTRSAVSPAARDIAPTTYRQVPAGSSAVATASVSPETRVVPRQVYDARAAQGVFPIPEGYRPVWDDDRLNQRRAEQSLGGIASTRLIWTRTVPRRLIDTATGRDVTTTVALVYPYTDVATQQRQLGTVTLVQRDGQLQKRIVRNKAKAPAPTVSTRSATTPVVKPAAQAAPQPKATGKGRYVQVGTFGVPENAKAAAQRIARLGLPARMGKLTRGGKTYQVVLAGPFATSAALGQGLQKSRAAGFSDAFVR